MHLIWRLKIVKKNIFFIFYIVGVWKFVMQVHVLNQIIR